MKIELIKKEDIPKVVQLSEIFAKENCCNGIVADDEKYFADKIVAVCKIENQVVGYICCEILIQQKDNSYSKKGDSYFEIDEIYVLKNFRNKGIGKKLFAFMQDYAVLSNCKTIRLNAVSKSYKQLLKLYINELGMTFHSAYLYKNI